MTKEELRSLTIEQLNQMSETELDEIANQVVETLDEYEIEELPESVRKKLEIEKEGGLGSWKTWVILLVSALAMSIMQLL